MPADHLMETGDALADRVEAVLAGRALERSPVHGTDLVESGETYRAGGRAALNYRAECQWFQALVSPADWESAEDVFANLIGPRLEELKEGDTWWFLRKHPHWRLRIKTEDHDSAAALLDELVTDHVIKTWHSTIYEPETAAFGGAGAMDIVHDLFATDSRGVLAYRQQQDSGLGRRELSLLLIRALQQHAGLDWFEAGDVFHRLTGLRPLLVDADRVEQLATAIRPSLTLTVTEDTPLFAAGGPVHYASPWLRGFLQAGTALASRAATGDLNRGLRAVLAQIVIFHWNRLGLSAHAQAVLAQAAKSAMLPRG